MRKKHTQILNTYTNKKNYLQIHILNTYFSLDVYTVRVHVIFFYLCGQV